MVKVDPLHYVEIVEFPTWAQLTVFLFMGCECLQFARNPKKSQITTFERQVTASEFSCHRVEETRHIGFSGPNEFWFLIDTYWYCIPIIAWSLDWFKSPIRCNSSTNHVFPWLISFTDELYEAISCYTPSFWCWSHRTIFLQCLWSNTYIYIFSTNHANISTKYLISLEK